MFIGIFYPQAADVQMLQKTIQKSSQFPCFLIYSNEKELDELGVEESNNIIFRYLINISLMKKSYKTSYLTSQTQNLVKH